MTETIEDETRVPYVPPTPKPEIHFSQDKASNIAQSDAYLAARTGTFDFRQRRHLAAGDIMVHTAGLEDTDTLFDIGSAFTELDYTLRTQFDWKGRYIPIDACNDGVDLERWHPERRAEWFVCLETIEHMDYPGILVLKMLEHADKGVVLTTPNPDVYDVLALDSTHKTPVSVEDLHRWGFETELTELFGKDDDTILAWKVKD